MESGSTRGEAGLERRDALAPGSRIGSFEIVRLLRAGGMATVYEAVDGATGERVVVKVLHPHLAQDPSSWALLQTEAHVAARVHHPGVERAVTLQAHDGVPFLVKPLLDGEDLSSLLAREGPLPLRAALAVVLPVLDALASVHAAGVVHCDLKPSNLFLVGPARDPVVLDFGVAYVPDRADARADVHAAEVLGTLRYMSPEQLLTPDRVDPRSDLFAMGVILYECLTLRNPFGASTPEAHIQAVTGGAWAPLHTYSAALPRGFEGVVRRALSPRPEERHATAEALLDDLAPFTAFDPPAAPQVASEPAAPTRPWGPVEPEKG